MVPMMKFWSSDQHAQRSEGKPHVGMDVNGPEAAKGEQAGKGFQTKAHDKRGQINQAHRIDGIQWMLAMGRKPIKMFGTVMDRMKAPKEGISMLQAVPPINQQIAQEYDFDRLNPPGLAGDHASESSRHKRVQPVAERLKHSQNGAAPDEVLSQEKRQVRCPVRPEE